MEPQHPRAQMQGALSRSKEASPVGSGAHCMDGSEPEGPTLFMEGRCGYNFHLWGAVCPLGHPRKMYLVFEISVPHNIWQHHDAQGLLKLTFLISPTQHMLFPNILKLATCQPVKENLVFRHVYHHTPCITKCNWIQLRAAVYHLYFLCYLKAYKSEVLQFVQHWARAPTGCWWQWEESSWDLWAGAPSFGGAAAGGWRVPAPDGPCRCRSRSCGNGKLWLRAWKIQIIHKNK